MDDDDRLIPGCVGGLAVLGGLASGLAFLFPPFAGLFQFAVTLGKDQGFSALELGFGGDVADGGVQADVVVVLDIASHVDAAARRLLFLRLALTRLQISLRRPPALALR